MNDDIKKLQAAVKAAEEALYNNRNRLRAKENVLTNARRKGAAGADETAKVEGEISSLQQVIERNKGALAGAQAQLAELSAELILPKTPQQLISDLDDSIPFLLLPVRIETRFMRVDGRTELWVRVFPDDIAVFTHEKTLTREEADAGVAYWAEQYNIALLPEDEAKEGLQKAAWRMLAEPYGGARAGWIASEIKKAILVKQPAFDLAFLGIRRQFAQVLSEPGISESQIKDKLLALLVGSNPIFPVIVDHLKIILHEGNLADDLTRQAILQTVDDGILRYLGFDLDAFKAETWSEAPRSKVMPNRFVLHGKTGTIKLERPFPNLVPDTLIVGPNPQGLAEELTRENGDLLLGKDFAWISQFDKAIEMGMGMRVVLPEPFASKGFDELMVIGIRHSTGAADNSALLEELIDNHHYSPDGFGFIRQGTPTNNTSKQKSGYSKSDPGSEHSYAVETGQPNFTSTDNDLDKSDAQRLAEALDISTDPLAYIANAGQKDVSEAKWMNKALWPATLGYFLEELLELEDDAIGNTRHFFAEHVQARGCLPAIRVGNQPYGILVSSAFDKWKTDFKVDGESTSFLAHLYKVLKTMQDQWQELTKDVIHVDASGDAFSNLLNMLGLQPGSVSFRQRRAYHKSYLWNWMLFNTGTINPVASSSVQGSLQLLETNARQLLVRLGLPAFKKPKVIDLVFSGGSTEIPDPLVDDVEQLTDEQWSEVTGLPPKYAVTTNVDEHEVEVDDKNYIGWLINSDIAVIKKQEFISIEGEQLPAPRALLYRMLHRSLSLTNYYASMQLYESNGLSRSARKEQDFINVEEERTVTRWEFMEAPIREVLPQVSQASMAVAEFLNTPEGLQLPAAFSLAEVKAAIGLLENLPTARLERLFTEHLDLCSYRLDAWETALFSNRLLQLRRQRKNRGIHIGAYGWLEKLRPASDLNPVPASDIPASLREDGVTVFEQAGNGGYIHVPSINHAVAAAVLRNAYLTHADEANPEHFSVNLSSERVRTALNFLEGIRNGQELGALLGYQFERGLHDRYTVDGQSLEQYILNFRKVYPLVSDKITPDSENSPAEIKEARHVLDGYALVEAAFLGEEKDRLPYPYGVSGLPGVSTNAGQAIKNEVDRMAASLDAIADLALAEGVFQVVQGNYERAGAMLKALSEGNAPPEPEIAQTPRSGVAIQQKMFLHFETGSVGSAWGVPMTPRSLAEPGMNKWIGTVLGSPANIRFVVAYEKDNDTRLLQLEDLGLQPIDLVYLASDKTGSVQGTSDLTELERRIDYRYRKLRRQNDSNWDDSGQTIIRFMDRTGFGASDKTLFELLPLLKSLRQLVSACRPLGANDHTLPSEEMANTGATSNPVGWDVEELRQRALAARDELQIAADSLSLLLENIPAGALNEVPEETPSLDGLDFESIRAALIRLSLFGIPDAFPLNAVLPILPAESNQADILNRLRKQQQLIKQGFLIRDSAIGRIEQANSAINLPQEQTDQLSISEKVDRLRSAARLLLGDAFNLLPVFLLKNQAEWQAALSFSQSGELTRYSHNPMIAEEWVQGIAPVREPVGTFERIRAFYEIFNAGELRLQPMQLPYEPQAYWVAVEYPEVPTQDLDQPDVFVPNGDYLSIVMHAPDNYDPGALQSGLLIDEWSEVIPNRVETTGIAVHYNQPSTEPPQSLLLAVSPEINGKWDWDDLVDIVRDTFARAKRRAVEPDHIQETVYSQLLPAIITSVTGGNKLATISTPLITERLQG